MKLLATCEKSDWEEGEGEAGGGREEREEEGGRRRARGQRGGKFDEEMEVNKGGALLMELTRKRLSGEESNLI